MLEQTFNKQLFAKLVDNKQMLNFNKPYVPKFITSYCNVTLYERVTNFLISVLTTTCHLTLDLSQLIIRLLDLVPNS